MDSARCKAFVASVDEGSFTAAGKLLGYTPSGVSQLVSALEDDLGFPLLIRKSRGVVMTKEGEQLYPETVDFIAKENNIYKIASELAGANAGHVSIASYSSVATQILPAIIRDFTKAYPGIQIQLQEGTKSKIERLITDNAADLAFTSRLENPSFSWIPFMQDPMVIILPPNHPYADKEVYPISEAANETFIMQGEGDDLDTIDFLNANGIQPKIRFTTVENHTAINMVEEGLGVSIMNDFITKSWDTSAVILPIDPPSYITLGITLPSLEKASPAVRRFIMFATDRLTRLLPE